MDALSPLAGTPAAAATKTTSAAQGAASNPPGAATTATTTSAKDTLSLSTLAASLKGPSLDLFNKLKQNERALLGDLVDSGKVTGDDVNNALMGSLKQARRSSFATGSMMFETQNSNLFARADSVTADEMLKATDNTLARRKELVSRLGELEKSGQGGSDDYSAVLRALSGMEPGADPRGSGRVNGPPRSTRIVSPYTMNLGDQRFQQSGAEEAASNKLKEAGVSLSALSDAARGIAEDDVAGIVKEEASRMANAMGRNGG
ncbi:hypothetical protein FBZ84_11419 [Azospirillum baldaniorum]|uniref:hypothetical protein n=1 Tax=Azospirillum baldaniorum TaxID=1064539 RepID=UPI00119F1E81|nr:hypothetical protein [Azospirillum baldaniorum]TWA60441.1 hypothetical protein FBZ84_11419 [Azospirillum baldaniorum]